MIRKECPTTTKPMRGKQYRKSLGHMALGPRDSSQTHMRCFRRAGVSLQLLASCALGATLQRPTARLQLISDHFLLALSEAVSDRYGPRCRICILLSWRQIVGHPPMTGVQLCAGGRCVRQACAQFRAQVSVHTVSERTKHRMPRQRRRLHQTGSIPLETIRRQKGKRGAGV